MKHEHFLVSECSLACAFGDGVGGAARQRANSRVCEKNFIACDGKFVAAPFFVRQNFSKSHAKKLTLKLETATELKSVDRI
jgi:hypothetical protein